VKQISEDTKKSAYVFFIIFFTFDHGVIDRKNMVFKI